MAIPFPSTPTTGRAEKYLLQGLTGISLTASEAREVLPHVLDHKYYLSEKLGRDVGLRVAAIDYLENVDTSFKALAA